MVRNKILLIQVIINREGSFLYVGGEPCLFCSSVSQLTKHSLCYLMSHHKVVRSPDLG